MDVKHIVETLEESSTKKWKVTHIKAMWHNIVG